MADPITMAAVGATAGALMDKEDPLRGAALGGMGGYAGATMIGGAAAGGAATGSAGQAALAANAPATITPISATMPVADVGFIPGIESLAMQSGAPVMTPGATTMMGNVPVTSYNIPFDAAAYEQTAGLRGAMQGMGNLAEGMFAGGGTGGEMGKYMALNAAQGLMSGPQGQQPPSLVSTPMPRQQGYQPPSITQGLLATTKRRKSPFALA